MGRYRLLGIPAVRDRINPIFEQKFPDDSFDVEVADGNILGLVERFLKSGVKLRWKRHWRWYGKKPNQVSGEISRRSQETYRPVL